MLLCILMTAGITSAQPKASGATFAFNGTALSYEHMLDMDTFVEMMAKVELSEVFLNTTDFPGFSLAVTWNHIIHTWKSANDNEIFLFAGPGITGGTARDFTKPSGYFLGIKGRFGAECIFHDRNVSISVCLAPVVGTHLVISLAALTPRII